MNGRLLLLDDDADLRFALSDFIEMMSDRQCLAVASFDEMVAAESEVLGCSAALLDVNLGAGKPTGIDAYRWLVSHHFAGRLYFFAGHARVHPLLAEIEKLGAVQVLPKPLDTSKLMEVLTCPTTQASSS
ncbi:MAG TPA: response regulator [Anaeromyxobacteraceae bacterium]|nr:response regulator [Anaeromyxobacteraceae bacterium]